MNHASVHVHVHVHVIASNDGSSASDMASLAGMKGANYRTC